MGEEEGSEGWTGVRVEDMFTPALQIRWTWNEEDTGLPIHLSDRRSALAPILNMFAGGRRPSQSVCFDLSSHLTVPKAANRTLFSVYTVRSHLSTQFDYETDIRTDVVFGPATSDKFTQCADATAEVMLQAPQLPAIQGSPKTAMETSQIFDARKVHGKQPSSDHRRCIVQPARHRS